MRRPRCQTGCKRSVIATRQSCRQFLTPAGPRVPRGALVPVPLNDVFGPCLMYTNFSDALKHPKIHPWTILANDLVPFVSGPLWDRAPGIGQVHSLNSSPPLWGGSGRNDVCPLHVLSFSTGAALLQSRRASRLTVVKPGSGSDAKKKAVTTWQVNVLKRLSLASYHAFTITVTANQHIKNSQPLGGRSPVAGHRTPCKQGNPQRPTTGCGRGRRRLPASFCASFCKTAGRGLNKGKSWRIAHTQNLLYPQLASLSAPASPAMMCRQVPAGSPKYPSAAAVFAALVRANFTAMTNEKVNDNGGARSGLRKLR